MPDYYPETRFVVCTANPDPELHPLAVYEVEHGSYETSAKARMAATPLLKAGENVQIFKRRWVEFNEPHLWLNGSHWKED